MAIQLRKIHPILALIAPVFAGIKRGFGTATLSDPGHTHAFSGAPMAQRDRDYFRRPDAAGTGHVTATAKADAQPKVSASSPDFPRVVRLTTAAWVSTASVDVTVTGQVRGVGGVTEVITLPIAGTTTQGLVPFEKITSITWTQPAGWTGGTFAVEGGAKLGLNVPPGFSALVVFKETGYDDTAVPPNPADVAVGAVDAVNGTYTPTTVLNAANAIEVSYGYAMTPAGTNATVPAGVSSTAFPHADKAEVTVDPADATDLPTALVLVNRARLIYEAGFGDYPGHRLDVLAHTTVDAANPLTPPAAVDLPTAITLANALKAVFNLHRTQAGVHLLNDTTNVVVAANAVDLPTLLTLANEVKLRLNAHITSGLDAPSVRLTDA